MQIDEHWIDVTIYYLKFTTDTEKRVMRTIVVRADWTIKQVKAYARRTLPHLREIEYLDKIDSGWLPRKKVRY